MVGLGKSAPAPVSLCWHRDVGSANRTVQAPPELLGAASDVDFRKLCAGSSGSSSSLLECLPLAETSAASTPPCIRGVSLLFIWRVLSTVRTLSFAVCCAQRAPAWGNQGLEQYGQSWSGSCAPGSVGQRGQQQGLRPGSRSGFRALLVHPLRGPVSGATPFSAAVLTPLTSLSAVQ